MSEYVVNVTGFTKRAWGDRRTPSRIVGGVVVRPPLQTGEEFKTAILGRDRYGVDVREVATTSKATIFLVESGRGDEEMRMADIRLIAERIGTLANTPDEVIAMMDQTPFPSPPEE